MPPSLTSEDSTLSPAPVLNAAPLADSDVRTCLAVLDRLTEDRALLVALPDDLRRALMVAAGRLSRPEREELRRENRAYRKQKREIARAHDAEATSQAGLRIQRQAPVYKPLWVNPPRESAEDAKGPELKAARACYVCKTPYTGVHFYYDSMCGACGDFNYKKREQTAALTGRVALVTGARVKIGFQAALKLLRAGARVVVTTRFPQDAAARYAQEEDFGAWSSRLQIHGIDLRHAPSVELFARSLGSQLGRLDFILNNACQTVRRPAGFYGHLLERERTAWSLLPDEQRTLLSAHEELKGMARGSASKLATSAPSGLTLAGSGSNGAIGVWGSAELSQMRLIDDDFRETEQIFPRERYDEDLQQVDLREVNSWRLTLADVATPELLEVHLVNAIAPYILNARLKPLMIRTNARDKHIVNVSAMEGQFYRATKTDKHPHTNMAKAALNMMTRTSAPDYAKDGIFMNAVDTGWVTDEDPAVHAARKAELGFSPPLDIIDGAARICDPIFHGQITGEQLCGQFLKDYRSIPW